MCLMSALAMVGPSPGACEAKEPRIRNRPDGNVPRPARTQPLRQWAPRRELSVPAALAAEHQRIVERGVPRALNSDVLSVEQEYWASIGLE